jgi:hypothetical protein
MTKVGFWRSFCSCMPYVFELLVLGIENQCILWVSCFFIVSLVPIIFIIDNVVCENKENMF